jgi:Bacterial protein of unknown function (DUF885)
LPAHNFGKVVDTEHIFALAPGAKTPRKLRLTAFAALRDTPHTAAEIPIGSIDATALPQSVSAREGHTLMRIFKWFTGLALVIVLAAGGLLANVWYFKPVVIDWFYDRVFAKFALGHPEMLSEMRILPPWLDFYGDKLDDASPAQDRREAGDAREALATLRRYDRAALTGEDRLSYDTLEYFLRMKVDGEKYLQHDFPVNQLEGVQIAVPNFMVQVHQVTSLGEANAYVRRL